MAKLQCIDIAELLLLTWRLEYVQWQQTVHTCTYCM